jgi:hypothetical protein
VGGLFSGGLPGLGPPRLVRTHLLWIRRSLSQRDGNLINFNVRVFSIAVAADTDHFARRSNVIGVAVIPNCFRVPLAVAPETTTAKTGESQETCVKLSTFAANPQGRSASTWMI